MFKECSSLRYQALHWKWANAIYSNSAFDCVLTNLVLISLHIMARPSLLSCPSEGLNQHGPWPPDVPPPLLLPRGAAESIVCCNIPQTFIAETGKVFVQCSLLLRVTTSFLRGLFEYQLSEAIPVLAGHSGRAA
jgi:hypothetical protein